ncbi:MAG: sodium:solute symporter [Saprospiraceae bacterium]|nr:sodium:solute symporter [Saprospiraceae bacterium]
MLAFLLALLCSVLHSQDLRLSMQWEVKANFELSLPQQADSNNIRYAYLGNHLAVFHSPKTTDTIQDVAIQPSCNLSIFASITQAASPVYSLTLPFSFDEIQEILVVPNGLVCLINSPDASKVRIGLIPSSWEEGDSNLIWGSTVPTDDLFAGAWANQNKVYLWTRDAKLPGSRMGFYTLDLDQMDSGWEALNSTSAGAGKILNIASQHDGLRNALFVLTEDATGDARVLKYDLQLDQWEPLPVTIPAVREWANQEVQGVPLGSADILYWGTGVQGGISPIFLFHTITESWHEVRLVHAMNGKTAIVDSQQGLKVLGMKTQSVYEVQDLNLAVSRPSFSVLNTLIIILYFGVLVWVGFYFSKRQRTQEDYFKGGNRIPWWAAGLSIYGTSLSAISFMAVPAKTYMTDWAYFMTKLPLILIPIIVGGLFIPFYKKLDITSAYEYLQKRFNLATRLLGSFTFIIFQLGRIGVVLYLPAIALNIATGWDVILCILLMGGVSLIYTLMGGIEAVVWTDVLQVIVLVGGIILCLTLISFDIEDGMSGIIQTGVDYQKFEILNMALDWKQPTFWVVVISGFFSNLITYSTDQSMVQRYLTTRDVKAARQSIWTYTWVSLSIGWIFFFVGTALFAFYKAQPAELLPAMASNDAIFPWYIISQLPDGVSGLLIAGIFAAAMSSLSSSMNSAATAYTIDFHYTFSWPGNGLSVGRWATLVIGIAGICFALLFATLNIKSIWDEFLKIIGLITGGLGGVFLLGIVSRRANGVGAFIGLLVSGVVQYFITLYQPIHFLLYTASGFLSCLVIGYLVSLLFPKHNKSIKGLTIYRE